VTEIVKRTFTNPDAGEKSDEWMANSIRANDNGTPWKGRNKSPHAYWVHGDYLAGFQNMVNHHAQNVAEKLAEQKNKQQQQQQQRKRSRGRPRGGSSRENSNGSKKQRLRP